MREPILIVGAGLGGLACALDLAAHHPVTLLEKSRELGGRARSPLNGGHVMNSGPRAVYLKGPLHKLLKQHGVAMPGFSPPTHGVSGVLDGALVDVPGGAAALLSASWLTAGGKRDIGLALARLTVGALDLRGDEPVHAWLARHVSDRGARLLIATLVRVATYDADPEQPASRALPQVRRALLNNVRYVDGGWAALVEPLAEVARAKGVTFVQGRVASLRSDAVTLDDGRTLSGRVVVAAGRATASLVHAPVVRERIVTCLDLVLDRLPDPARRVAFGLDEPLYFSVHTDRDVTQNVKVHVMSYTPAAREELDRFVDLVQPGWRDHVVAARFLPQMTVSSELDLTGVTLPVVHDAGPALLADGVVESAHACAQRLLGDIDAQRARAA